MNRNEDWMSKIPVGMITLLPEDPNAIEIVIGGDVCPIGRPEKQAQSGKAGEVLGDLATAFKSADISIVNLECPLTNISSSISKTGPSLHADPISINILKEAGINTVTLANNHILDQGSEGIADTIANCQKNQIHTVGAGSNLQEAVKPLIVELKGKKVAIFSMADHEFSIASRNTSGANPLDPVTNYLHIQDARKEADHVIVILHAGNEHYSLPNPQLQGLFRYFIDIGADIVIGHHPHCPGGIEIYKGKPLVYSLGNLVFDIPEETFKPWYTGFVLKFRIGDAGVSFLEMIPYSQYREQAKVQLLNPDERTTFFQEIERLSQILAREEDLASHWDQFCKTISRGYLAPIFRLNRIQRLMLKKKWFTSLIMPDAKHGSKLLNLIQSDAHRGVLINLLEKYSKENNK